MKNVFDSKKNINLHCSLLCPSFFGFWLTLHKYMPHSIDVENIIYCRK